MKEKNRKIIEDEVIEDSYLYFEIIGLIIILMSIIILTTLGNIGYNLMLFFKLFFGDWYWLVILFILYTGGYFVVKHDYLNFKSLRFNGVVLITLSLLVLSHFPINDFLELTNNSTIFGTWQLYVQYLSNYDNDYIMGGGIIGGILFQIFEFLLGKVGTKIITIIILLIGVSFIFNLSVFDSLTLIKDKTLNFRKILKSIRKNFSNYSHRSNEKYDNSSINIAKIKKRSIKPKNILNLLMDIDYSMNKPLQNKVSVDLTNGINNILNIQNIEYIYNETIVGASVTSVSYKIITNIDLEIFKEKVKNSVDPNCLVKYDFESKDLICEINNKFRETISLKKLILNSQKQNEVPIGETIDGNTLNINFIKNRHLFISGSHNSGIKNFVKSLLISLYIKNEINDFKLCFYDYHFHYDEFYHVKNLYGYNNTEFDVLLKRLTNEIEKRLELFNYIGINQIGEYNQKIKNNDIDFPKMECIYFIINSFENIINSRLENSIMYLAQVGEKCGIHLIVINRIPRVINSIINSVITTKILLKVEDSHQSTEIIDFDYGLYLQNKGDFIYKYENNLIRGQSPYISESEISKIIKKISI